MQTKTSWIPKAGKTLWTGLALTAAVLLGGCAGTNPAAADVQGMVIENGMAQQIVRYSDAQDAEYTNEGSEILRFTVYVETDHDTDGDGKADLIKTIVQLPRPAAEGIYKAPVIYEARPYIAGIDMYKPALAPVGTTEFDEAQLLAPGAKRTPVGAVTASELAAQADPADWFYVYDEDPYELQYMQNLTTYDDLLVCGFAVVQCAGLGTRGSEGIECCTSRAEAEAFACVIDWLCGRRNAFTDLTGATAVGADWCSGRVGMTGRSYAGAMAFEVASLGTEGLETVVPVAAPGSWYDFTNSQGIASGLYNEYDFAAGLSAMCASRLFEDPGQPLHVLYDRWLSFLRDGQVALAGDYGPFWAERDYLNSDQFHASALIVQGLQDMVVHPKQYELMREAFARNGCEVRCLLHRNGHVTPANEQTGTDLLIGAHTYTEWMNLWFTHYLLDVDNDVNDFPPVMVQSNLDGTFYGADVRSFGEEGPSLLISGTKAAGIDAGTGLQSGAELSFRVSAKGAKLGNPTLLEQTFDGTSGDDRLCWSLTAEEEQTVAGVTQVHLRVQTNDAQHPFPMLAAVLVDAAEEPFPCYDVEWGGVLEQEVLEAGGAHRGEGAQPYDLVRWKQRDKNRCIITYGSMDLRNPEAGFAPSGAVQRETPIEAGVWYDYVLYLQPTCYTVRPGHRLELYIVPYCAFSSDTPFYESTPEEELREMGFDPDAMLPVTRDYTFTVDCGASYAVVPVLP